MTKGEKKNIKKLAINTLPWVNRMDFFFVFLLALLECQYIRDEWNELFRNRPIKPLRDANLKTGFFAENSLFSYAEW
jgi:hypothetical protein